MPGTDAPDLTRGSVRLVLDRRFGALFWGKLLSALGVWIHVIVAALVVYAATGSALWVGLTSVAQFTPQLVLAPLSGTWADRGNVARQIVLGRVLCFLGSGSLAVLCLVAGVPDSRAGVLVVLGGSLLMGFGFVVGGPAQQSVIPLLVTPDELGTAMALNSLPMTLARVAGPALGALIATRSSEAAAFGVAAATHLVFIVLVHLARLPGGAETDEEDVDYSVRTGVRYVLEHRAMLVLLLAVAGVGFASDPSITLAPTITEQLGAHSSLVGQLTGSFGAGAGLGFLLYRLLSRRLSQPQLVQLGLGTMILGLALACVGGSAVLALASFLVMGAGFMPALTAATTLIQQQVPATLRGRVMALWMMGFVGSRPLAASLNGFLADHVSLVVALAANGVLLAVLVVAVRTVPLSTAASTGVATQGRSA